MHFSSLYSSHSDFALPHISLSLQARLAQLATCANVYYPTLKPSADHMMQHLVSGKTHGKQCTIYRYVVNFSNGIFVLAENGDTRFQGQV